VKVYLVIEDGDGYGSPDYPRGVYSTLEAASAVSRQFCSDVYEFEVDAAPVDDGPLRMPE
jgi:hypothetical protein